MDRDPLTGIPPSRHPFQIWLLAAAVFSGAQTLIQGDRAPATLEQLIPSWSIYTWAALLLVAGVLGIPAGWWRDRITGLLMERIALASLAVSTLVYASILLSVAGKPGTVSACFQLSVGIACVWRILHVGRELRGLKRRLIETGLHQADRRPWRDPTEDE